MASNLNDSFYEIENIDVTKVIRIQANIKGYLVRKRFKYLREVFLNIVESLETKKEPCVQWNSLSPCYPCFIKLRKHPLGSQRRNSETKQSLTPRRISNEHSETTLPRYDAVEKKMVSVEIQTNVVSHSLGGRIEESTTQNAGNADVKRLDETSPHLHSDGYKRLDESGGPMTRPKDKGIDRLDESRGPSPHFQCEGIDRHDESGVPLPCPQGEEIDRLDESGGPSSSCQDEGNKRADPEQRVVCEAQGGEQNTGMSDTSSLTDVTSLWGSQVAESRLKTDEVTAINSSSILEVRKNLAMELLWVQQAITSRKHYLSLKAQME